MAVSILAQTIFNAGITATSYTNSFAVPSGTELLLVIPTMRELTGGVAASISSITQNGVTLSVGFSNYSAGNQDINSYIGYRRDPDVGTFNIVITCAGVAGGAIWVLALSGAVGSGSPVGVTNAQKNSSSTATSVGLGLTPTAGSMLLTAMASGNNTGTVTAFSGSGFADDGTGRFSANGDMPYTARHVLGSSATAVSVSATFSVASPNCGGLLAEILAEATGTDVAGTAAATLGVSGSVATETTGVSKAEITDASFRQRAAWTEVLSLQADVAGVDRRILSAGIAGSPTMTIDQLAPNKNLSFRYRLADGTVQVDSGGNTQSLSPQHWALVHNGASGQQLYLNGNSVGQVIQGDSLSGAAVVQGGEIIGAHGGASPAPYTGLVGRYLLYGAAMTPEQVQLLALSETDPDSLWGVGVEDDAQVTNQSVVACPLHTVLDGQPSATLSPRILDPSGGVRSITGVTQPANGSLSISGLSLVYQPTRGWQGSNSATYTATDGTTSSTGRLTFRQTRPALKCANDTVTCASGGSVTFDPRTNDVGAGTLQIVSYSGTSHGAVTLNPNGTLGYSNVGTDSATSDSFSYTVQDDYGQQSATVSITISAGSFLVANDVSASTTKDKFIDIDVVADASVSADLSPAVVKSGSVTAPALGTAALQTSGKIRYTPPTGDDGFSEEFDFTLKPSAKALPESTATVTVDVLTAVTGIPRLQPDVPVSRWHCVGFDPTGRKATYGAGRTGFAAAVAATNLVAGDVIVLADGTYSGASLSITKNGAAGNHIMVRAQTHGKAVIDHQLNINGAYWWFTGIKFTHTDPGNPNYQSGLQAILIDNAGLWITNCRFTGHAFIHIYPDNRITNLRFCYNTVNASTPGDKTDTGIFITCWPTENGDRAPPDTEIAWNRVTLPTKASNNDTSRPLIILHSSHSTKADQNNFITQSFRFHHNHCVGAWAEAFYVKRNICIEFNYIEWTNDNTARWMVTLRHGLLTANRRYDIGGIIRGNRFKTFGSPPQNRLTILISGTGNTVACNVREGGNVDGEIWVLAGNGDGNFTWGSGIPRDGADNAQLVENTGFTVIRLGGDPGSINVGPNTPGGRNGWPEDCRIYKGDGGWNPTVDRPSSGGNQAPAATINPGGNVYGTGNAAKVTPITASALLNAVPPVGCDPIA